MQQASCKDPGSPSPLEWVLGDLGCLAVCKDEGQHSEEDKKEESHKLGGRTRSFSVGMRTTLSHLLLRAVCNWQSPSDRFIQAEHHGIVGRTHVEPDDIPDLVHKLRIGGVAMQPEGLPDACHAVMRQAAPVGRGPRAPVGGIFGALLQGDAHDLSHPFITDASRCPAPGQIQKPSQAILHIALPDRASPHDPLQFGSLFSAQHE